MLVELIVEATLSLLGSLIGLLPEVTFPFQATLSQFAAIIGSQVGALDGIIPISEAMPIVKWSLTIYLPFCIAYGIFRWIYSMLPVVGQ